MEWGVSGVESDGMPAFPHIFQQMQRGSAEELGDLIDVTKFCAPSTSSFVEHKAAQKNSQIRTIQEDD